MKVLPQAFNIFHMKSLLLWKASPCTAKLQNQQTEVGEGICCWSLDYGKAI